MTPSARKSLKATIPVGGSAAFSSSLAARQSPFHGVGVADPYSHIVWFHMISGSRMKESLATVVGGIVDNISVNVSKPFMPP